VHRREFLAIGAAAFAPACGQQPKVARVAWMSGNPGYERRVPAAFAERGFRIGENLALDFSVVEAGYAWTIDRYDKPKLREIVAGRPDVIVVHGTPDEVLKLTRDIPVVFYDYTDDPEAAGYVKSLRHPGGNVTGANIPLGDLAMKRWQLMKIIRPDMKIAARIDTVEREAERRARIAANEWLRGYATRVEQWERDAASALGIEVRTIALPKAASAVAIATAVKRAGAQALAVSFPATPDWKEFIRKAPVPTFKANVDHGFAAIQRGEAMLGWDFNSQECETQAVAIVARILRGEKPATIPVYLVREYRFAVNTRVGREAAIEIPASVLIQAEKLFDS
jgi:putative ABC transport system substrate-binding protein